MQSGLGQQSFLQIRLLRLWQQIFNAHGSCGPLTACRRPCSLDFNTCTGEHQWQGSKQTISKHLR